MTVGIVDERLHAPQFDAALLAARQMARETKKAVYLLYGANSEMWRVEPLGPERTLTDEPTLLVRPSGGVYPEWEATDAEKVA